MSKEYKVRLPFTIHGEPFYELHFVKADTKAKGLAKLKRRLVKQLNEQFEKADIYTDEEVEERFKKNLDNMLEFVENMND